MAEPQQLLNDGQKTGIWVYDRGPTEVAYALPVSTIPVKPTPLRVLFADSVSAGPVPRMLLNMKGTDAADFASWRKGDQPVDAVILHYDSPQKRELHRGAVEKTFTLFTARARAALNSGNIPSPLVNPVRFVTAADFEAAAAKFIPLYEKDPAKRPLIAIDGVIEVFNNLVARPHKGEIQRTDYGWEGDDLVLGISLKGNCGGTNGVACPASEITVQHGLRSMLKTYAGNLFDKLVVR